MSTQHPTIATPRRGIAAAELTIALPLLILFSLATVDFARFAYVALAVDNAARVGAVRGSTRSYSDFTYASWEADVKDRVDQELADLHDGWLTNLQVNVTVSDTSDNLHRIEITVDGDLVPLFEWPFIGDLVSLHREITYRQFR